MKIFSLVSSTVFKDTLMYEGSDDTVIMCLLGIHRDQDCVSIPTNNFLLAVAVGLRRVNVVDSTYFMYLVAGVPYSDLIS